MLYREVHHGSGSGMTCLEMSRFPQALVVCQGCPVLIAGTVKRCSVGTEAPADPLPLAYGGARLGWFLIEVCSRFAARGMDMLFPNTRELGNKATSI